MKTIAEYVQQAAEISESLRLELPPDWDAKMESLYAADATFISAMILAEGWEPYYHSCNLELNAAAMDEPGFLHDAIAHLRDKAWAQQAELDGSGHAD